MPVHAVGEVGVFDYRRPFERREVAAFAPHFAAGGFARIGAGAIVGRDVDADGRLVPAFGFFHKLIEVTVRAAAKRTRTVWFGWRENYDTGTSMALVCSSGALGRWTCSVPSLNSAWTFSVLAPSGSTKERSKLP